MRIPVLTPFRLDRTVAILRRFESNVVDRFTPGGVYLRAFGTALSDPIVFVRQSDPGFLELGLEGDGELEAFEPVVRRMLGLDANVKPFARRAAAIAWLKPVVRLMAGVRPPRYPSLFEASVNAIVFQQISIAAASSMMRRTIASLGAPRSRHGEQLYGFPGASVFAGAADDVLLGCGLSSGKVAAIKRVAAAILDGSLAEAQLAPLPSPEIAAALQRVKGIGPWTAAVILLRGFGRLDVFPEGDSGAKRSLELIAPGLGHADIAEARAALGPYQGMLYYSLLMGRLAARGALPEAGAAPATAAGL
jgi:DNA-3-methyladenine glycosylase II